MVYSQSCVNRHHHLILEHFITPEGDLVPINIHSPFPTSTSHFQPVIHFLYK